MSRNTSKIGESGSNVREDSKFAEAMCAEWHQILRIDIEKLRLTTLPFLYK